MTLKQHTSRATAARRQTSILLTPLQETQVMALRDAGYGTMSSIIRVAVSRLAHNPILPTHQPQGQASHQRNLAEESRRASIQLAPATEREIAVLTEARFGKSTAVIRAAIAHMYAQEIEPQASKPEEETVQ